MRGESWEVCRLARSLVFLVLVVFLAGCRSVPPPPPQPALRVQAREEAEAAARLAQQDRWPAAAASWEKASELYALLNQRDQEALARHNLAQALQKLGRPEAARSELEQAASLNQALDRQNEWWRNRVALIQLAASQEDHTTLTAHFQELLGQAGRIADPGTRALFWNEAGLWHLQNVELPQAEAALVKAQMDFARAGDKAGWAMALANQALALERQNQFRAAHTQWQAAQAKFQEVGHPMGIATALAGQGRTLVREKRDLARAEDLLRRAAANFQRLQASSALASTRDLLQETLRLQGRNEDAQTLKREDTERKE